MPRRAAAPAALSLAFLAACSSAGSPSASLAPSEAVRGSPSPSATGDATELRRAGEPLALGRYTRAGFSPRITFEIAAGEWYAEQLYDGFFDVQQDVGSPDVIAVQFALPSAVYGAGGEEQVVDGAEEAAAVLREHPGLVVLGESEGRTGGHEGFVIEVEHGGASSANVSIMTVPPGPLTIAPDRRLWVSFLDTDEGLLAVMVGGSVARWDEALAAAEPILESVMISD
jgi:hypothetical protein